MDWRRMTPRDLDAVAAVADRIHPDFPEDRAIFAERLRLFPEGCHVLADGDAVCGYVLSHPWTWGEPPRLNSLLGRLPRRPTTYYLHDIALLPQGQGQRHAGAMVERLAAMAAAMALGNLSLVAVNDSTAFWKKQGFDEHGSTRLGSHLASYGAGATFMIRTLGSRSP
jgi:ribosomal protein S18 acetylase RimI-like enzyme